MLKILLSLLFATTLFASSAEDRGLSLKVISSMWNMTLLPDEKSVIVNVPIDSEDIIWIEGMDTVPKGWIAYMIVHVDDLMLVNPLMPDIKVDYLDKNQKDVRLMMVTRQDGRGVQVGPDANVGVSHGPIGVRFLGGKATGFTGSVRCKVYLMRSYEEKLKYKKENGIK